MKRTRSNGKLEVFAQELAKGKSAPEAARAAGYEGTSLVSNATKRAASPRVRERVAALQARLAKEAAIDSAKLIEWADQARLMAIELKKPGEVIRAIETIAKLCGLWKEKQDLQNQFNGPVTFEVHYTREGGERRTIDVTPAVTPGVTPDIEHDPLDQQDQ
jgi:phage terminase small subunit